MAFFNPLTAAEWFAIGVNGYNAEADIPAYTGPGSTEGAIAYSASQTAMQLQTQLQYLALITRLYTIPAINGYPSPDAISFCAPFNIQPIGSLAATGSEETSTGFTFATASAVSGGPLIQPVGAVAVTPGGLQFVIVADAANPNYNAAAGGYPIGNGDSSTVVTMTCLTPGSIGNLAAGTQLVPYNAPGQPSIVGIASISNANALTSGQDGETDAAFKSRFTLTVSSGRAGTANAITGAVLATQTGLIFSFGDRVNADGSTHNAYFTFILNEANTGSIIGGGSPIITAAEAAINGIYGRSAGISFQCIPPAAFNINIDATVTPVAGFTNTQVTAAATAQITAFLNALGLNPDTTPISVKVAACYVALMTTQINGTNCVADVPSLTVNGQEAGDISVPFAYQALAGTINITAS
jgi:uncharacterized phage protein gp47/JayE